MLNTRADSTTTHARLSQLLPILRQQARVTAKVPIYELIELYQTVDALYLARALMESALTIITSYALA
jgi:hypothetical protein